MWPDPRDVLRHRLPSRDRAAEVACQHVANRRIRDGAHPHTIIGRILKSGEALFYHPLMEVKDGLYRHLVHRQMVGNKADETKEPAPH